MNIIDIILVSIIGVLFILGTIRGLIKQLFSMIAFIGAVMLGLLFYDTAATYLLKYNVIAEKSVASLAGFILIALIYYILIQTIAWLLTKLIGKLKLSWLNRLGGGALGIIIGIFICHFVISGSKLYISEDEPVLKNSIIIPYVEKGYSVIKDNIPEELKYHYQKSREYINSKRRTE